LGAGDVRWSGSIPAPAGPMSRVTGVVITSEVHPRACGADPVSSVVSARESGPSPRLRGRRIRRLRLNLIHRSIPAPAGPILVDLRFPCNKDPFSFSRKDLSTVCTVAEPTHPSPEIQEEGNSDCAGPVGLTQPP